MRDKTDPELGIKIRDHLAGRKLETLHRSVSEESFADARDALAYGLCEFFEKVGLNPEDPSIKDSPLRVADMLVYELCAGLDYANFPKCTTTPNSMSYDEMVTVERIQTISLCEHHLVTIYGHTHVAYIPKNKILGLSKFARVTEFFARRPQIQERMTAQIYEALVFVLETEDVAVVQKCDHFCMKARGVMHPEAVTTTSKLGGKFMSKPALRKEFFDAVRL